VAALHDDSLVNFLPRVDGIASFKATYPKARRLRWQGMIVRVLPLEAIIRSKNRVGRPKDLAHLPLLRQALRMQRKRRS